MGLTSLFVHTWFDCAKIRISLDSGFGWLSILAAVMAQTVGPWVAPSRGAINSVMLYMSGCHSSGEGTIRTQGCCMCPQLSAECSRYPLADFFLLVIIFTKVELKLQITFAKKKKKNILFLWVL